MSHASQAEAEKETAGLLGDTKCHFVHKSIHSLFPTKTASVCSCSVSYVVLIPLLLEETIRPPASPSYPIYITSF